MEAFLEELNAVFRESHAESEFEYYRENKHKDLIEDMYEL
jgi:hypothetical protein